MDGQDVLCPDCCVKGQQPAQEVSLQPWVNRHAGKVERFSVQLLRQQLHLVLIAALLVTVKLVLPFPVLPVQVTRVIDAQAVNLQQVGHSDIGRGKGGDAAVRQRVMFALFLLC